MIIIVFVKKKSVNFWFLKGYFSTKNSNFLTKKMRNLNSCNGFSEKVGRKMVYK